VRCCKLLLLVFALTSCGQPLAMRTTPRATPPTILTSRPTRAAPLVTPSIPEVNSAVPTPASATPAPAASPTSSVIIQPQSRPTPTSPERWRAQQLDRRDFSPARRYLAPQGATLFWFDPRTSQPLAIGTLLGEFPATAQFTLRESGKPALAVPYTINRDYGLTAISEALIQRMRDAGYTEHVEAYIVLSEAVKPK